jgi:hypothetical protein
VKSAIGPIVIIIFAACTNKTAYHPNTQKYLEDTELMINISSKFLYENNADKLHKVAVATEQSRVLPCADFNGECSLYGKFIAKCIDVSADGIISSAERRELEMIQAELKGAIKEGLNKLKD